jgi:GNAT superfamily N-acetyltransferase
LRLAVVSDVDAIIRVRYLAVHNQFNLNFYTQDALNDWASSLYDEHRANLIRYLIEQNKLLIIVVETNDDHNLMGYGSIGLSVKLIGSLYVNPIYQHKGIGSMIIKRLEELAWDNGIHRLYLDASLNAELFYSRNGYLAIERVIRRFHNGMEREVVKMIKDLKIESENVCCSST